MTTVLNDSDTHDHYYIEKKRFIIELMTGVSLEDWHKNNLLLQKLIDSDIEEIDGARE